MIYKESENLSGLMKIALVKISVGQLVLLSIVQELLGKFGGGYCMPYDSGSCGDIVYGTQRAYCK